ncbi:type II toxin-antitoxin system VapC family toxin [Nocardioides sp. R-C-SC26]|uniref:type II toxin-antitoxin system VapC family toxin n=1 Tax=Nocardioides sp. R-C-SC26 TaxID=2870414 RepID=UPI001E29DDF4|nr:type II toxin-antitoxin system VapC family toxin [Nocardioides sp. R-C-SC26]
MSPIAVDTSALIAVLRAEVESEGIFDLLARTREVLIGAPTLLEASMVARRVGPRGYAELRQLLEVVGVVVVDFTSAHATRADEAFQAYGKGSGHPAQLNFGDCLSYAVASIGSCALLFKGDDFVHTDLRSALAD